MASRAEARAAAERRADPGGGAAPRPRPGADGLDPVKTVRAGPGAPPVVVLSMHDESVYAERALRAGASAYLMKSALAADLIAAIRRVLAGGFVVGPSVVG